jgi:PiT family inorganic phosphate transporter
MLIIAAVIGFALAFSIGANDVANSMATAVGAKAISPKQAVWIAAILEFAGAVLFGSFVVSTIMKGIIRWDVITDPNTLMLGSLSALIATTIWILAATFKAMPISTTHSIVGGMIGFGIVSSGLGAIHWTSVLMIVITWLISPVLGGLLSYSIFRVIQLLITHRKDPDQLVKKRSPIFVGITLAVIAFLIFFKSMQQPIGPSILYAFIVALASYIISAILIARILIDPKKKRNPVQQVFRRLQVITSCYVAFSHGANDVANAIGPVALIFAVLTTGVATSETTIPIEILIMGGIGISLGVALLGKKVMHTVGHNITRINNTRGYAIDFGAATTVLLASVFGFPVSTTHTVVGAVTGIGMARGKHMVNWKVLRNVVLSWLITVPLVAACSGLVFWILRQAGL